MGWKIGTSGWQYEHWRGAFYPPTTARAHWLEHYAEHFATVESDSAFYRLPERSTFADWVGRTPDDFEVALKASRHLTHVRRLREPEEPVRLMLERLEGLDHKCGPVLLQLPPNLAVDADALDRTLRAFGSHVRLAVEVRHRSWFDGTVRQLLERRGAALCLTDTRGRYPPLWRTASWGYVRFHRGRASPDPCYGRTAIGTWAERIAALFGAEEVYCYFNNDGRACAIRDAHQLAVAARRLGVQTTRTPPPSAVTVGLPVSTGNRRTL